MSSNKLEKECLTPKKEISSRVEEDASPVRHLNFDKSTSQIKSTTPDGTEVVVQINIDVFDLKILAFLMCKGKMKVKSDLFFDLIIGPEGARM